MEKSWKLYMLRCGDGSLYTGIAVDVEARLAMHRCGKGAKYTRGRGPLKLRYRETAADKGAALKRELVIKRLRRQEKMAIIHEKMEETLHWLEIHCNK